MTVSKTHCALGGTELSEPHYLHLLRSNNQGAARPNKATCGIRIEVKSIWKVISQQLLLWGSVEVVFQYGQKVGQMNINVLE